ncbi:MAG: hypothetical protein LBS29_04485 [Endomicrobium sp.]|jgi:hypothetical protein|nr:hypothetical protein [Endomicrobium sp.]
MKYLDIIALLNLVLQTLKMGKVGQINKSNLVSVQQIIVRLESKLKEVEDTEIAISLLHDVMMVISEVCKDDSMKVITSEVQNSIIDSFITIKRFICSEAFRYYSSISFNVDTGTIPIMKEIVAYGGGYM